MAPFERYLYDNGLFDDVIRPEITVEDVILETDDHCIDVGCEHLYRLLEARSAGFLLHPRMPQEP
jgi:hypothetical protein